MPEKIQIGHRVTDQGELRLLLKEEGAEKTLDFGVFEWLTLISIMSSKLRDAMADTLGQSGPRPMPKAESGKPDILIAQNIRPIRSKPRGS